LATWIPAELPLTDKYTAGPLRIVNLLMAALVIGRLNPRHRFWKHSLFKPFIVCGQNSLMVFCTGVILCASVCPLTLHFTSRWLSLGLGVAGCFVLLGAGQVTRHVKESWAPFDSWAPHWMKVGGGAPAHTRGAA
jgi:hypothetical protein